jgi:hypothetical protein
MLILNLGVFHPVGGWAFRRNEHDLDHCNHLSSNESDASVGGFPTPWREVQARRFPAFLAELPARLPLFVRGPSFYRASVADTPHG